MGNLKNGTYKHVIDSDSGGLYASGFLLYHLQSQLLAQEFDSGRCMTDVRRRQLTTAPGLKARS